MQVTTQIVQPDTTDTTWIPLEETIQVIGQRGVSIQHPNVLIITHVRAFEHFKYPVSRNVTVLCVGSKTKAYLEAKGFKNVVYHKSASQILIEDRFIYYWLHGDKYRVNFRLEGSKFRENVIAIKTFATYTLIQNTAKIVDLKPDTVSVYSQAQYKLFESCRYVPKLLRVVPSVTVNKDHWNKIEVFNPA